MEDDTSLCWQGCIGCFTEPFHWLLSYFILKWRSHMTSQERKCFQSYFFRHSKELPKRSSEMLRATFHRASGRCLFENFTGSRLKHAHHLNSSIKAKTIEGKQTVSVLFLVVPVFSRTLRKNSQRNLVQIHISVSINDICLQKLSTI